MGEEKREMDLSDFCELDDVNARRCLRSEYRDLAQRIEQNAEEVIKPESNRLQDFLQLGEELFTKVRHPREAVCDSAVLRSITKRGTEQVQNLKTDVVCFQNHVFAAKVLTFMKGHSIADLNISDDEAPKRKEGVGLNIASWEKLGEKCCPLFDQAPVFDFLLGPLIIQLPVKAERRIANRQKMPDKGSKVTLKTVDKVVEHEEATTKEVERILKILKDVTDQGQRGVPLFNFIVNPHSFGQTVENLFHLSFLVKDGKASIDLDDDELPVVNLHQQYCEENHEEIVSRKQVVMPLTMNDWSDIVDVYDIRESMIPQRGA